MNSDSGKLPKTQKDCRINPKKALNKKKWREQKYNNKAKVLKWENIKRRQALRQYRKELKKSGWDVSESKAKDSNDKSNYKSLLSKAKLEYQKIREAKEKVRKEKEENRRKKEEALKAYREKREMRNKKLFHKYGNGKPSMKGRLELLLQKIQEEYGNKKES